MSGKRNGYNRPALPEVESSAWGRSMLCPGTKHHSPCGCKEEEGGFARKRQQAGNTQNTLLHTFLTAAYNAWQWQKGALGFTALGRGTAQYLNCCRWGLSCREGQYLMSPVCT
jgi:hypothetical protein